MTPEQVFLKTMSGTKRIMEEFRLNEISAVDRPAQVHATAAIIKRRSDDEMIQRVRGKSTHERMEEDFEEVAAEIRRTEKVPHHRAFSLARKRRPDLYAAYQEAGQRKVTKAHEAEASRFEKSDDVLAFEKLVAEYARDFGCTGTEAMTACRTLHKAAFAKYQSAAR